VSLQLVADEIAQDSGQDRFCANEERHAHAAVGQRSRHLEPDVPAAHDRGLLNVSSRDQVVNEKTIVHGVQHVGARCSSFSPAG
jgi:hypothetical protein